MRSAFLALMLAPLLFAPPASAAESEAPATPLPRAVAALVELPGAPESALPLAFYAQLEQQGALPRGATDALARGGNRPPGLTFRDAHGVCDLDGDGVEDIVSNDLTTSPPRLQGADSRVQALSGANGDVLWTADNLVYSGIQSPPNVRLERTGAAQPGHGENVKPTIDVDGDGVCDVFAYGTDQGFSVVSEPFFNSASVNTFKIVAKLLSGKDGTEVWSVPLEGRIAQTQAPPLITMVRTLSLDGFPTGFLPFDSPEGPRVLVKTTDVRYVYATEPLNPRIPGLPSARQLLHGNPWYETLRIDDHVQMLDATNGKLVWQRDLLTPQNAQSTNVTWISGVGDLNGDGELDVLLDAFTLSNPRGSETNNPSTGKPVFRYGRGVSALALAGADGSTLWSTVIVDPEAPRTNLPVEENHETIAWSRAEIGPDVDGDDALDPIVSFVVLEEGLGGTTNGLYRTHFVSLAGTNGTQRWDVRQQGWGVIRGAGTQPATQHLLAMGMLDVPTPPPPGGRFPPKFVRMGVLDGSDGSVAWSYEKSFAQNSYLSYNLALSQYEEALAPLDLDKDGILDLVTPAQYAPAVGRTQVLLATATHSYEVRSGLDGAVLSTLPVWGPDGRLVACGSADDSLTFVSGHGRRLDFSRVDAATGATVWRRPVFSDPSPHAASSGVDVLAIGASCLDRADGTTTIGANLDLFSAVRRAEVAPVIGVLNADGSPAWIAPEVLGNPTTSEELFQASIRAAQERERASPWPGVAAGSVLGALAAAGTVFALRRTGRAPRILGITLAFLVLGSITTPLAAPAASLVPEPSGGLAQLGLVPPAGAEPPALASDLTPRERVDVVAARLAQQGYMAANQSAIFEANETISFTYDAGDLDGDGIEDLIFDHYCSDFDACYDYAQLLDPTTYNMLIEEFTAYKCGPKHNLYAVSGGNKSILWAIDLEVPGLWFSCGQGFMLGTAPLPDGRVGALVYRYYDQYTAIASHEKITHDFTMYDAKTGEEIWTFHEEGFFVSDLWTSREARNIIVNPVLLVPPPGLDVTGATEPALFLQGVGFIETTETTAPVPLGFFGFNRDVTLHDGYHPQEWAARIDLATGQPLWRVDTFQPDPARSVFPSVEAPRSYQFAYGPDNVVSNRYWDARACCFDATGDGVPDMVFRTLEWNPSPNTNANGPHVADSRFIVYDGATGERTVDAIVTKDIQAPMNARAYDGWTFGSFVVRRPGYVLTHEALGSSLLLRHEEYATAPYKHVLSGVDGATGDVRWTMNGTRDLRLVTAGDVDGDGANDFLMFDWVSHDGTARKDDSFATPADVPLVMRSGATGEELWRVTTYSAPIDVAEQLNSTRRNGMLDVDGDRIGDFTTDAPDYLGEQTVIHHVSVRSGKDARALWTVDVVGEFALPSRLEDVTNDGRDDVAIISGDVNDLWVTVYDGDDGTAQWSRRVLALPISSYSTALPKMRLHVLHEPDGSANEILMDFHLLVTATYFFIGFSLDFDGSVEAGERTGSFSYTMAQVLAMNATTGEATWTLPGIDALEKESYVAGETPGTQMYHRVLDAASPITIAMDAAPIVLPGAGAFAAVYVAGMVVAVAVARYARKFEGVPDLE